MRTKTEWLRGFVFVMILAVAQPGFSQEFTVEEKDATSKKAAYSPFVDQHYPTRVLWGDTHLHTANSFDAGFVGGELGPEAAYRFARGEEVTSATGVHAKLVRPLDFLVISDHAEYFGLSTMLRAGDPALLADPVGKRWYEMFNGSKDGGYLKQKVRSGYEGHVAPMTARAVAILAKQRGKGCDAVVEVQGLNPARPKLTIARNGKKISDLPESYYSSGRFTNHHQPQ